MKIIYDNDGSCSVLIPAPKFLASLPEIWTDEEKAIHVANKDLPTGTKYEIADEVSNDRIFRNAWEYVSGAGEKTSLDLSLEHKLKYNRRLSSEEAAIVKERQDAIIARAAEEAARIAAEEAAAEEAARIAAEKAAQPEGESDADNN